MSIEADRVMPFKSDADATDDAAAVGGQHPDQNAMQDEDIVRRLEEQPANVDAQLDAGLDQSMDASDPPAALQPGDTGAPMLSSGFDEAAEDALRDR